MGTLRIDFSFMIFIHLNVKRAYYIAPEIKSFTILCIKQQISDSVGN